MGIAGVALMFGIISFFRLIGALIRAANWSGKAVCPAVITGIQEQRKRSKTVERVIYTLDVNCEGIHTAGTLKADVDTSKEAIAQPGTQLNVKRNEKDGVCREASSFKKDILSNLGMLALCIVIFIACYFIAGAIS